MRTVVVQSRRGGLTKKQRIPSDDRVAEALKSGDLNRILPSLLNELKNRSRIFFDANRDVFQSVGMNKEDVFDEVQIRLAEKITNRGYDGCNSVSHRCSRTYQFLKYSYQETLNSALRKRSRERRLQEADIEIQSHLRLETTEQLVRMAMLRECIEELAGVKQRNVANGFLRDDSLKEIGDANGMSRQAVGNMKRRILASLKKCIEAKQREEEWTPTSKPS